MRAVLRSSLCFLLASSYPISLTGALVPMLVNMFQIKPPLEALIAICTHSGAYARNRTRNGEAGLISDSQRNHSSANDTKTDEGDGVFFLVLVLFSLRRLDLVLAGNSYTHLLERLMDNPRVLDQLMGLAPVKRLIKDTALLKTLMNGSKGGFFLRFFRRHWVVRINVNSHWTTGGRLAEMFDDREQLEALCDMIISGELSMQELTDLLNEIFGYEVATENSRYGIPYVVSS